MNYFNILVAKTALLRDNIDTLENHMSKEEEQQKHMSLEERLEAIETKADAILDIVSGTQSAELAMTRLVGISDIAKMLGVTRTCLYTSQRYRVPNFGKKMPGEEMKWTLGEVVEWNKQPIDELRRKYMEQKPQ